MRRSELAVGSDVACASICVSLSFSLTFLPSLSLLLSLRAGEVGAALVVSSEAVTAVAVACGFSGASVMVVDVSCSRRGGCQGCASRVAE